jgi:hypothetical protein
VKKPPSVDSLVLCRLVDFFEAGVGFFGRRVGGVEDCENGFGVDGNEVIEIVEVCEVVGGVVGDAGEGEAAAELGGVNVGDVLGEGVLVGFGGGAEAAGLAEGVAVVEPGLAVGLIVSAAFAEVEEACLEVRRECSRGIRGGAVEGGDGDGGAGGGEEDKKGGESCKFPHGFSLH